MAARIARKKPAPKPEPVVEPPVVEEVAPPSTLRRLLPACIFVAVLLGMVIAFYNPDHKTTPRPVTKSAPVAKNTTSNSVVKAKYDEAKAEFAAWKKKSGIDRDDWLELSQDFYDIYTDAPHWPNRPAALMRAAEVMQYVAEKETSAEDFIIAVDLYKKLANEFSQSILADDALYAAARIMALQQKKKSEALKLLQHLRTKYPKGDMLSAAKKLEASLQEKLSKQKTEAKKVPPQKTEVKKETVQASAQKTETKKTPPQKTDPKKEEAKKEAATVTVPKEQVVTPTLEPTIAYVIPRPPLPNMATLAKKHKVTAPQVPQDITLRNVYGFESSQRALPPLPVPEPLVEVALETQEETKAVTVAEKSELAQENTQTSAQPVVQPLVLPMPKLNASQVGAPMAVPVAMPTDSSAPLLAAPAADRTAVGRSKSEQMVIALHMPKPMQPVAAGESEKKPLFEKRLLAESMPIILPVTQGSPHVPQLAQKPTDSQQAKTAPELIPYIQQDPPSSVILSPPPVALLPTPPKASATQKPVTNSGTKQEEENKPQVVAQAEPTVKKESGTPEKILRTPPRLFFTPDLVPDLEPLQWPVLAASVKKPVEAPKGTASTQKTSAPTLVATAQKPEPIEAVPPAKLKISHAVFDKTTPDPILTESYTGDIQPILMPAHKPTSMVMVAAKDAPRPILESDILAAMPKPKHEPMTKPQTSASALAKATPKPIKTETLQREHQPGSLVALSQQDMPAPKSLPRSVPKPQDEALPQVVVTPPKAAPEPITVASLQSVTAPKVTPRVAPQSSAPQVTVLEWALNLFTSNDAAPKIVPEATPIPVTPQVSAQVIPPKAIPEPITVVSTQTTSTPKVSPRVAPQTTEPQVTAPKSAPNLVASHTVTPKLAPRATPMPKPAPAPETPPALSAKDLDQRVKQAKNNDMAAQLGLSVRTVYVDIGHGGRDPGTMHNGLVERDVVLDVGKRVGKLLTAQGFNVVYSRTTDVTLALSSRPKNANEVGADLFVSIHMNAFTNTSVSGFETYYLDFSRNSEASRVATLENSVSDKTLGDLQDVVAKMLLNVRTKESIGLARSIQKATVRTVRSQGFSTKDGGTRSAPFHVLIGTSMPAVLVEIGYCTNKKEAQFLKRSDYRTALAQGIVQGIIAYKKELEKKTDEHFALTQKP